MRSPRVVVPGARPGGEYEVTREDARHLTVVLRRVIGDSVEIVGDGRLLEGRLERIEADDRGPTVRVRAGEEIAAKGARSPLTVAVALVKGSGMDQAVRSASELGLDRLVPLVTERTQVRTESGRPARWRRLAEESAKQCGRAAVLEIGEVVQFADLVAKLQGSLWIASPAPDAPSATYPSSAEAATTVLIGPEGGFSEREVDLARERGAAPLVFPTPVLRTPTAVVLVAALRLLQEASEPPTRTSE